VSVASIGGHLTSFLYQIAPMATLEPLYVVLVHFNPQGYKRRDELFAACVEHMLSFSEVRLVTEVVLFPEQDICTGVVPTCLSSSHSRWVHNVVHRVGVEDSLWFKENLVNLGVEAVGRQGGRAVAWVDADITFTNLNWATDTVTLTLTLTLTLNPNPNPNPNPKP
jgi:hypothetical protein